MKVKELKKIINNLDDNVDLWFYLLPKDKGLAEHSDENDIQVGNLQVICENGLDYDKPFVDIGLEVLENGIVY
jgi:hypothetical protein